MTISPMGKYLHSSKSSLNEIDALAFAYLINDRDVFDITEFCSLVPRNITNVLDAFISP